jgi:outer membrane biosynthesis protein TonB
MRGLLYLTLKHKAIAIAAVAVLSTGTVATFASQDAVFQGLSTQLVGEEATATPVPDEEATPTPVVDEPTPTPVVDESTPTPTPEPNVDEPTPTPEATEVVEPTPTATAEDGDDEGPRDVAGIPDSNPVKQPEDGDGVCEKGETVIKTTPSGKQVNVPCQAAKDLGSKAGKKGVENGEEEEATD